MNFLNILRISLKLDLDIHLNFITWNIANFSQIISDHLNPPESKTFKYLSKLHSDSHFQSIMPKHHKEHPINIQPSNKISHSSFKKVIKFYKQCHPSHQMRLSFNKRQFHIHYEFSHKSSLFIVRHTFWWLSKSTLGISSSISAYNEVLSFTY